MSIEKIKKNKYPKAKKENHQCCKGSITKPFQAMNQNTQLHNCSNNNQRKIGES
jgi:hypothetical protein